MSSSVLPAPLISAGVAAHVLCDYFLANADRDDHAANDALIAEMVHRMRAGQTRSGGASPHTTGEAAAVLHHRGRVVQ